MVAASFVMALISIATFQIFFVSLPCASISIILALISRGDQPLLPRAKAALICAAVAAVLTTSVTVFSVYTVMHDPQLRGQVEQYYNYLTNPEGFTPEQDDTAKDGEALLRDILSGEYRKNQQAGISGSSSASGSSDQGLLPDDGNTAAARNGGRVI